MTMTPEVERRMNENIQQIEAETETIVGYKLSRPDCPGWLFAGVTATKVAAAVRNEIESNDGLSAEECGQIVIEAYETTQAEIDALPEFQGW